MTTNTINPDALYWASFNSFELRIPGQAVLDIARSGSNDEAVASWAPTISAIVTLDNFANRPTPEKIVAELCEHGAWRNLDDPETNWHRLVWIAAWNIAEDSEPDCSEPVR